MPFISPTPISKVINKTLNPTITRPPTEEDRTLDDFLYAFSIHYALAVIDARSSGAKLPNREYVLRQFCQRWLKEGNLTTRVKAVIQGILDAKGVKIQMRPGVWVPNALFMFDSWFQLLIGRKHRHPHSLDIPVKWLTELDQLSTAYALASV